LVKMSAYCDDVGTCRTQRSPTTTLADEVEVNLNMLRALILNRVGGHVDGADVVTIYQCGTVKSSTKLLKELTQPCRLGDSVSHCAILSFSTGS
jgi:hypothetical protein